MYAIRTKNYESGEIVQTIYHPLNEGLDTVSDSVGNLVKITIQVDSRVFEFSPPEKESNILSTELEVFNKTTDNKIGRSFVLERLK
jgi:hypothetical protein